MPDNPGFWARLKSGLETFREALIISVVLCALIVPKQAASYLYHRGFNKLDTPLGEIDLGRLQAAGAGVEAAQRDVPDAAAALRALSGNLPPATRAEIAEVAAHLDTTATQLKVPGKLLDAAVQTERDVQPTNGGSREGWIYVGHVDESKAAWSPNPTIVQTPTPSFSNGEILTITDDVYIRGDSSTPQRNQAPVVGVIRAGEKVRVMDVSYTHALRG
jgi:hypothetical protein